MAAPVSLKNSDSLDLDTTYDSGGTSGVKLALTGRAVGSLTPPAQPQAVGTHSQGDTFNATDPVAVVGGVDNNGLAQPVYLDATGGLPVAGQRGGLTDASGTITSGGVSQTLVASNAARRYLVIQNVDPAEDMWIDFGTAAVIGTPSILLPAGGGFVMDAGFCSTDAVDVIAATTSHPYSAKWA